MKRARRLRKGDEFDRAYREGTVLSGPLLVVRVLSNSIGHVRWGFAVGKKMLPLSVDRNRVRRRLREAADALELTLAADVVVTARPGASHASVTQLSAAIMAALARNSAKQSTPP